MEEKDLQKEIQKFEGRSDAMVISDQPSYELAGEYVVALDGLLKKIRNYWEEPIKKAHETHKALTRKRAEMCNPVEAERKKTSRKVSEYLTEQDRIRREEQRKLDEQRRKEEKKEQAKLDAQIDRAKESGKKDKVKDLEQEKKDVFVPPAVVEPTVEKTTRTETATVTAKQDLEIEIVDINKVLSHIVSGTLPNTIVTVSIPKLKQVIKLHGLDRLDGVVIQRVSKGQFRGK